MFDVIMFNANVLGVVVFDGDMPGVIQLNAI